VHVDVAAVQPRVALPRSSQGVQELPQESGLVLLKQASPQAWKPLLQV
jgi:hypothetical protein